MITQKELYEEYVENDGFDEDFEFLGEDGKVYLFDVDTFEDYIRTYGESNLFECIQGDLEGMTSRNICSLVKE